MMQSITRTIPQSEALASPIPPFSHRAVTGADLMSTLCAAEELAERIVGVWAAAGHSINAWAVKLSNHSDIDGKGQRAAWGVRTDLVNGMPSGLGRTAWERKYGRGI